MWHPLARLGGALLLVMILAACGGGGSTEDDQAGDVEPGNARIDSELDESAGVEPPDAPAEEHNPLFHNATPSGDEPTADVDDALFFGATAEPIGDAEVDDGELFGEDGE